jgi:hypothetical protein
MGIRIALGASGAQLVRMVVRQGMIPVVAGLGAGLVCALFVSRLIASQLYGVAPTDPLSIAADDPSAGGGAMRLLDSGAACHED